jgi:3-oxoacyl-[acyl-carrier-protein] synthase II
VAAASWVTHVSRPGRDNSGSHEGAVRSSAAAVKDGVDMGHPRVVITGLGATTPLGGSVDATWDALLAGRSGVRALHEDWATGLPVRIASPVLSDPAAFLGRHRCRRLDRVQQLALVAAQEAWSDAGCPDVPRERLAVVLGSGVGGFGTMIEQSENFARTGSRGVRPRSMTMSLPDSAAVAVGLSLGARAGVHTPVSACASGAEAVAQGLDLIRLGRADVVVVGGAEAGVHRLALAGFASMRALSARGGDPMAVSRPFDASRDGFVLGEGAATLVLEREDHAIARGVAPYAEMAGAGMCSDAHHVIAPHPEGDGAARAMSTALFDAHAVPHDVLHVNAHATSTPLGDLAEAIAIHRALGKHCGVVSVTGTKSMTGHLLGAAGALEAVVTVLTLHHRVVPATRNLEALDDSIDLDVVNGEPRPLPPGLWGSVALSNSFGFGGHNVSLAIRQIDRVRPRRPRVAAVAAQTA